MRSKLLTNLNTLHSTLYPLPLQSMRIQSLIVYLITLVSVIATTTIPTGCANIIPPQGGPRDTIPPVLLKATPADRSTEVGTNRLVFSFDEFVELQNAQQELIVSPLPVVPPTIESKLREVTVRLRDSLQSNTTYTIHFGNSIKDYNEGNVLKNFQYSFSTGKQLDSGQIKGKLILAETGKPDTTLIAILHRSGDDSAILNLRPAYITRLNGKGEFVFEQLPNRDFYLYALKDDGGMRRIMGSDARVAFADAPIRPSSQPESITLYAFDLKEKAAVATTPAPPIPSPGVKGKPGGAPGSERRLRITNNLSEGKQDLLGDLELTFEQPITRFDTTGIRLFTDTSFKPAVNYTWSMESTKRKIRLRTSWTENTLYKLVIEKEALKDTLDRQLLKTDTLSFTTRKRSDYGKLSIRLRNIKADSTNDPVIQLVLNETVVAAARLGQNGSFRRDLFLPGTYEIRILYDQNANGRWDSGQLFPTRRQPERVRLLERKITVKSNWENEYEL